MKWWPGHIDDVWRALGLDGRVSHPREALEAIEQLKRECAAAKARSASDGRVVVKMGVRNREMMDERDAAIRERDSDRRQVVGYYIAGTHGSRPPTTEELRVGAASFGYEYLYPEDSTTDETERPEPDDMHGAGDDFGGSDF